MEPTLLPGERVLVNRLAFRRSPPLRGDIVLARHPQQPRYALIKRIAAVPGDQVVNSRRGLQVNGKTWVEWERAGPDSAGTWRVGPDEYFLLGDAAELHPAASTDSRSFGPVSRRAILGRVWAVYWPPRAARRVH